MYRNPVGLGLAVLLLLGISGCGGTWERDSGGRPGLISAAAPVEPQDADLNIGGWIDPLLIRSVERRTRDAFGILEEIRLAQADGPGHGRINTERLIGTVYSPQTFARFHSIEYFNAYVAAILKDEGYVRHDTPRRIANVYSSETIGFKTVATTSGMKCFVALAGYRFWRGATNSVDTLMRLFYCRPAADFSDFETLVSSVSITRPGDAREVRSKLRDIRPLAVEWSGYDKPVAGNIELEQTRGGGTVRLTLPNNEGQCSGSYRLEPGRGGTWEVSCTNGLTASGTLRDHGAGRGSSGEGIDSKGRSIKYTLGAI